MALHKLEHGARYRAAVKATAVEKMFVNHASLNALLAESGFCEVTFKSTRGGFIITGRYGGPSVSAALPARVVRLVKLRG